MRIVNRIFESKLKIGDLRVWWYNNFTYPDLFYTPVRSVEEAIGLIEFESKKQLIMRGLEWNAFGLEVVELDPESNNPEWTEWVSEDDEDIMDVIRNRE